MRNLANVAESICAPEQNTTGTGVIPMLVDFEFGGNYNLFITEGEERNRLRMDVETVTPATRVHMFWQVPQITILTASETLLSVVSYEFAFTQAPSDMKAIVQSIYLTTTAFGNLVNIVIIENFTSKWNMKQVSKSTSCM